ncbi:ubiquinol-cytochrome c reductase iron-sulfur subunit [Leptolyngbya sp. FACHB-17]|uniref:QcrA and Rieske domain-containing protein n=1 Tax=unclassified Leptolyngbya TaxID=2650499 RepID=UPI0016809F18|nr:ubiquinol-cytochrome c reductase iron-sulfur subunit [Leptolyngbya sp. FACHB-17]MBD2081064.1 ubiquinol-cytochrome c reductase iron-sulfur subunit [Leptolyngbya sp. FACHB-17]
MRRRTFLSWAGVGWLMSRVPAGLTAFLAACTGRGNEQANAKRLETVGTIAELDAKGFLQTESPAPIVVIRSPSDPKTLIAVNSTCTHQGCLVGWSKERKSFVCPCHGAAFAADGTVQKEPAAKPLETYPVQIDGQNVQVKLG